MPFGLGGTYVAVAQQIKSGLAGTAVSMIASGVLAAPAATIDFSSIPTGFKIIVLYLEARTSDAGDSLVRLTFNADAGNNYYWTANKSDGTNCTGAYGAAVAFIVIGTIGGSGSATQLGMIQASIGNKTGAYQKSLVSLCQSQGSQLLQFYGGTWTNTSEVNRLTCALAAGQFIVGTKYALVGYT